MGEDKIKRLRKGLIVSCQADKDSPLFGPQYMSAMAKAAEIGGAVGIRANGPEDIRAIREVVDLVLIGIYKVQVAGYPVYITPTFEAVREVAKAGADIIACDATLRERPVPFRELVKMIHLEFGLKVMADISTREEGLRAVEEGADLIATTLSGYTPYSPKRKGPDIGLIRELAKSVDVPVIGEGRFRYPWQVRRALKEGAYAVVVGNAITNPISITRWFCEYIRSLNE
ncbi:MAG: N-acetylmannosamine-6-phosphate 2-epimerase [bacterium]